MVCVCVCVCYYNYSGIQFWQLSECLQFHFYIFVVIYVYVVCPAPLSGDVMPINSHRICVGVMM